MEKKTYETAEMNIINIQEEDIIRTSGGGLYNCDPTDPNGTLIFGK